MKENSKVKVLVSATTDDLERKINDFISNNNVIVEDIHFSSSENIHENTFSVLISYCERLVL
jgi:hypothetical protein